jgi:transcription elongation factor Elf1
MPIVVGDRRFDRRATDTQRKERSAKNKGKFFGLRLDIPEEPIKIHLQRPKKPYQDPRDPNVSYLWKKGAKHYIPKYNRFIECAYDKCLVCAYRNPQDFGFEGVQAKKFLKDCWPKDYYSFCGWVEEWHLVLERVSTRKDEDGGEKTYHERVLERQAKKELKEAGYDLKKVQVPRVFGKRFYIDISAPAWHNEYNSVYEQVERLTKDGGYLFPLHYGCSNCGAAYEPITTQCPSCGEDEIGVDHQKHRAFCGKCETEWELLESRSKELKSLAETIFECPSCDHQGYPIPIMAKLNPESGEVTYDQPKEGWETYDIFDVQLTVRKERSKDNAPPRLVIDDWSVQEPDPKLFSPEHQGGKGDETAVEMARKHGEPLDLNQVHSPDPSAVQAKVIQLDDLFSSKKSSTSQQVVSYKGRSSIEQPDTDDETD